jgi:glycosyltransferase involved in cell wall biosynthesis
VVVAGPSSYRRSSPVRHLQIAWRALTAKGPFDGVEAHPVYIAGVIGLAAARLRRKPLVAYAHGSDVAVHARSSRLSRWLARRVAHGAGAIVANSADTARAAAWLGVSARVISPGVDMGLFRPSSEPREAMRLRLGLEDGPVALFVGHLADYKGADVFASALGLAAGWHGVAIGDGPLAASLTAEHPQILWLGAVPPDEVASWLQAADVVIVPSRREGLGLVAVEALACGIPVVASAVGGLLEVVRDGENGLLVPPGDPAAVAAALDRLADPELRAGLGEKGPASMAHHDMAIAARQMAEVWAELGVRA